ncbi:MAG: haloalkane dehalogenase [Bacteroidia bacterium]|nr:haloalkane dehalogenase [Bacteroidia bacterium]
MNKMTHHFLLTSLILSVFLLFSCDKEDDIIEDIHNIEDHQADTLTSSSGVQFVRTPDECFQDLPDWPYAYQYVEIDGLRQAYVESGPANGELVLLIHGQPSWSYLYRSMIPVLADAGYRVIAMDHLGMGRSDKPTDLDEYSYLGHASRMEQFIQELGLSDINLFVQDWGSLIGLRVAGLHPEWFSSISVGNGTLPVLPSGTQPIAPIANPNVMEDLAFPFANFPPQQTPFYDSCELIVSSGTEDFEAWANYAMKGSSFKASEVLEALTWFDLPTDEEAAYDAPFPSRAYMAGARKFPSLVNELAGINEKAWAGLSSYEKPFLTIWGANDAGSLGACETQQNLIVNVPGAAGKPHVRLDEAGHFLQDDQGVEIANRLIDFYATDWDIVGLDSCENFDSPIQNEARTQFLAPPADLRNFRYGEVMPVFECTGGFITEVYATLSFNDCPEMDWYALDGEDLKNQMGAVELKLNGPRHFLMNQLSGGSSGGSTGFEKIATFGNLQMQLAAQISGNPDESLYTENEVQRSTTFVYKAGNEVYKLINPQGEEYVMQSYSRIINPNLAIEDLSTLGTSLNLPAGWTYKTEILTSDLSLTANGIAYVIQDDLENSYQKVDN